MKEFVTFDNNIIYQGAHTKKPINSFQLKFLYLVCYSKNRIK